jgi:hypothetical protein
MAPAIAALKIPVYRQGVLGGRNSQDGHAAGGLDRLDAKWSLIATKAL